MTERSFANCRGHHIANLEKLDEKGLGAIKEAVLKAFLHPKDHERFEEAHILIKPGERYGFARVTFLTTDWSIALEVYAFIQERKQR